MRTIHHAFLALLLSTFVSASFADESKGSSDLTSKVIGTYEFTDTRPLNWKLIFWENGALQRWGNGKIQPPGVWEIVDGEIHVKWADTAKSVGIVKRIPSKFSIGSLPMVKKYWRKHMEKGQIG